MILKVASNIVGVSFIRLTEILIKQLSYQAMHISKDLTHPRKTEYMQRG